MISSRSQIDLLERSIDYALVGIAAVDPSMLHRQTPCSEWDLHDLLSHLADSILTLSELLSGAVGRTSGCGPAARATDAALDLRQTIASVDARFVGSVGTIDRLPIARRDVILTGALEIAIHAWDVEQVSSHPKPIPAQLARDLLPPAPLLLDSATRRDLFAPPVEPMFGATAAERLVAFCGRAARSWANASLNSC